LESGILVYNKIGVLVFHDSFGFYNILLRLVRLYSFGYCLGRVIWYKGTDVAGMIPAQKLHMFWSRDLTSI
jgi:hypothetical protein